MKDYDKLVQRVIHIRTKYEEAVKALDVARKIRNLGVKRGSYIICTSDVDWAYRVDDRMWVDSVEVGHVMARPANKKYRNSEIYWVTNSDWVLDTNQED